MRHSICVLTAVAALAVAAPRAFCVVPTFFSVQNDVQFIQTGPSTVSAPGFQFLADAEPDDGISPIAFDGGTVSFPSPSPLTPQPLSPVAPDLQYSSPVLPLATFQADYPIGTYTFNLTDSSDPSNTQQEAVDNSIATAPTTVPMLTAASFNALQGMDPSQSLTVDFNSFADANSESLIFFDVVDSSNNVLVEDGLQPGTTQDTIPAGTLSPGQPYSILLFYANFAITPDNNAEVIMDNRTEANFATLSVPEPASGAICLITIAGAGMRRRKRSVV